MTIKESKFMCVKKVKFVAKYGARCSCDLVNLVTVSTISLLNCAHYILMSNLNFGRGQAAV